MIFGPPIPPPYPNYWEHLKKQQEAKRQLTERMKKNELHRNATSPAHSNPTQQSSPSPGTGLSIPTWRAFNTALQNTGIPYAGIRAGEIIGWRVWGIDGRDLFSITVGTCWHPGVPMTGNVKEHGVYAFNNYDHAYVQYRAMLLYRETILGTVELWGEVIEHEFGYRAENARITSLLSCSSAPLLERLAERYNVTMERPYVERLDDR